MDSATTTLPTCRWCGLLHQGQCPRVKAIEYYPDGTVKRVEFNDGGASPVPVEPGYPRDAWYPKPWRRPRYVIPASPQPPKITGTAWPVMGPYSS